MPGFRSALLCILVAVGGTFTAAPAWAQSRATEDSPAVGFGLTFFKWLEYEDSVGKGLQADFTKPIALGGRKTSVVVDVTLAKDGKETDTSFTGGLRWPFAGRSGGAMPFVQVTAGLVRWSVNNVSDSAFALQPGGGVLLPINPAFSVKGQVDFIIAMGWEDGNILRFTFGGQFGFGNR